MRLNDCAIIELVVLSEEHAGDKLLQGCEHYRNEVFLGRDVVRNHLKIFEDCGCFEECLRTSCKMKVAGKLGVEHTFVSCRVAGLSPLLRIFNPLYKAEAFNEVQLVHQQKQL